MPTTPYRYVEPVTKDAATGVVAQVYAKLTSDSGLIRLPAFMTLPPVFMTLSPAPDVLAAIWAVTRESLLAGRATRTSKEVVALAVSVANRCPFCVDAHTIYLHATGEHQLAESIARGETPADPQHAKLVDWAMATRTPGAAPLSTPPFAAGLTAEYVGTALAFHFINRTASALLDENLLPGNLQKSRLVRRIGGRVLSGTVRRPLPRGGSRPMLAELAAGPTPTWAAGTPIGAAFAALHAAASAGAALLSEPARAIVLDAVAGWDGAHPPLAGGWLSEPLAALPDRDRPAAKLALLAALAPYRVTDADVAAWRTTHPSSDADLVRLIAFGAITAVHRIEASIIAA
jgi:AhpD family alkylhydroperoxidase